MMTKEQRLFHERMNDEIIAAVDNLRHEFDIRPIDLSADDKSELLVIRSNLKGVLLKAYTRNHNWIAE